ncbi:spermidine synthase [Schaalia suimastitidis]|uniref:spermidine synthase n=1 Tax=Schaalia suimastitidis TaxID=121163 RepID=UPI000401D85D|nr:fused MFS/spermidine synthase [Schaalia suimastitidis]
MSRRLSSRATSEFPIDSGTAVFTQDGNLLTLFIDGVESSCIDLLDPTHLEFEYMQHATCVLDSWAAAPPSLRTLHIGGAGCALARAWVALRPTSRHVAIEIDEALATLARQHCDLPRAPQLKIRVGEGRAILETLRPASWDVIMRDAFIDGRVPTHLCTVECAQLAWNVLRPGGIYIVNAAHGGGSDARVDAAALREVFPWVVAITDPKVGRGGRRGNVILAAQKLTTPFDEAEAASTASCPHTVGVAEDVVGNVGEARGQVEDIVPIDYADLERRLRRLPLPARPLYGKDFAKWCAGTRPLHDATS